VLIAQREGNRHVEEDHQRDFRRAFYRCHRQAAHYRAAESGCDQYLTMKRKEIQRQQADAASE
jgi:hypothetical protein